MTTIDILGFISGSNLIFNTYFDMRLKYTVNSCPWHVIRFHLHWNKICLSGLWIIWVGFATAIFMWTNRSSPSLNGGNPLYFLTECFIFSPKFLCSVEDFSSFPHLTAKAPSGKSGLDYNHNCQETCQNPGRQISQWVWWACFIIFYFILHFS